jgi:uncharacterized C2H2 Zn-finger protein
MCKYSTTTLTSTSCLLPASGSEAHIYTKYYYFLCPSSRNSVVCSNLVPKENQNGADFGSRQGPCPVCQKLADAEREYEDAVDKATREYKYVTTKAWEKKLKEEENSSYVHEVVSAPGRRRHHYRDSY